MCSHQKVAFVLSLLCAGSLFAGNVCTWQGGSGKLSDDNWDIAPVSGNGDTIRFDTTDGTAITVENDTEDFEVAAVAFADAALVSRQNKSGAVTLTGKRLYVSGAATGSTVVWHHGSETVTGSRGPKVTVDMPLRFKGGRMNVSWGHTFNQKLTIDDNGSLDLRWPSDRKYTEDAGSITFSDEIDAPNATIENGAGSGGYGSYIYYKGKVTAKVFNINKSNWGNCRVFLQHLANEIGSLWFLYATLYLDASPALSATTLITMSDSSGDNKMYVRSSDVVCDRVTCSKTTVHQTIGDDSKSGKLTMRASADGKSAVKFTQGVSLVWDPQGPYAYTLTDSESTTTGSLELKGGTFKLAGTTAFSALSEVIVRKGATLDLTGSTAASPFAATTKLIVNEGGKIVLPTEGNVTFGTGFYKGIPLAAAVHTSEEPWVEGGTVTIANGPAAGTRYWAAAVDGAWNVAANWIPAGVPTATDAVTISAEGEDDYTVHFAGTEAKPAKITVRSEAENAAKLSIDGAANFTIATAIDVLKGGEIRIPSGGSFVYDMKDQTDKSATTVRIADGRFVVSGGFATFTNTWGVTVLSGATGELLVENGELVLADRADSAGGMLSIRNGAKLRMAGGTISIPSKFYYSYLTQQGGACEFAGGTLKLTKVGQPNCPTFSGDVTFSNDARLSVAGDVRMTVKPTDNNGTVTFTGKDSATQVGDELTSLSIGGKASTQTVNFQWDSSGIFSSGIAYFGTAYGTCNYRQTDGLVSVGAYGLVVGGVGSLWQGGEADSVYNQVEANVEVAGGALTVAGTAAIHPTWGYSGSRALAPGGLVLGYGASKQMSSGRPYVGKMTVSGSGAVTNTSGHLFVGVAPYGEGSFVMNGGTLRSGGPSAGTFDELVGCAVGVGGGKGEFVVNGGDCRVFNNMWVGGVWTNAVRILGDGVVAGGSTYGYPFATHGGEGLLKVTGGSVAFTRSLTVGAEGTGVVAVEGSVATAFTVGRDLVLSNEAAFVSGGTTSATLKFKADADGVTPIAVAGNLVVTPQAKLEIDMTGFDLSTGAKVPLVTCASMSGAFGAGNVTVTGCNPEDVRFRADGICVKKRMGIVLIVK